MEIKIELYLLLCSILMLYFCLYFKYAKVYEEETPSIDNRKYFESFKIKLIPIGLTPIILLFLLIISFTPIINIICFLISIYIYALMVKTETKIKDMKLYDDSYYETINIKRHESAKEMWIFTKKYWYLILMILIIVYYVIQK